MEYSKRSRDEFAKHNFTLSVALIASMLVAPGSLLFRKSHMVAVIDAATCHDLDDSLPTNFLCW